jgi:lipopolysaccharide exporter
MTSSTPSGVTPPKSRSTFATDVLKLVSGSASAQVLTILTAPFVARLFAPSAFGIAAVFVSITGVISAVVGMRYELSIVLPEKDEDAANAMAVSLSFIMLTSALTAVLAALAGDWLLGLLHAPELHKYLWLAPIMVFLNGVFAALSYWNTRKKKFGRQTLAQLAAALFFVGAQIGAGLTGHSSGAVIIVATVLSILLNTLVLGTQTWCECWRLFVRNVRLSRMWAFVKRYSDFPKYSTASAMLNNLGWQIPTFMLSAFFSATVVGHYAMGNKVLRIPVNLIGVNIATVFFQHASESRHQGTLGESVNKVFKYLVAIFVFPSLLLCMIGKDLFLVAFGSRWAEAGVYTEILSIYVLLWFMAVPLGIALNVLEKQALELRLVVLVLLARVAALYIGGRLGDARLTLALFSVAGIAVYGYYCLVVLRLCNVSLSKVGRVLSANVATFLPAGLVVAALKYAGVPPPGIVAVSVVLLALYYLNLVRTDAAGRELLAGMFQKYVPARSSSTG